MPLALTVTLLPTFLLTKAKVPPLSESPPYSVPPVTMAVPAALVVASYTLFTLLVLTVSAAGVMVPGAVLVVTV